MELLLVFSDDSSLIQYEKSKKSFKRFIQKYFPYFVKQNVVLLSNGSLFGILRFLFDSTRIFLSENSFNSNKSKRIRLFRTISKNLWRKYNKFSSLFFVLFKLFIIISLYMNYDFQNEKTRSSFRNCSSKTKGIIHKQRFNLFYYEKHLISDNMCSSESIDQGRSYNNVNIEISNCFFLRSSLYSGDGGVININAVSLFMSLSYSVFYNCIAKNGGAIYFSSSSSYLNMICASRCSAGTAYYHFAYLVSSVVNHVEYTSFSNCSDTTLGFYSIYIKSGEQSVKNINSSMNHCGRYSGIYVSSPTSFTSTHCTFSNNIITSSICIYLFTKFGKFSSANIVHNNSPSSSYGVIMSSQYQNLDYCIFQNNQNTLFSGNLEITNSFIDHYGITSSINNNSLTKTSTYRLHFFNSVYCSTDLLVIGLTPSGTKGVTLQMTLFGTQDQTLKGTPSRSSTEVVHSHHLFNRKEIGIYVLCLYIIFFQ